MSARQLALPYKKLRGIPRRIRALKKWADSFKGYFPDDLDPEEQYWNWKIPVIASLVQGKQTTTKIQAECAQQLINAAYNIYQAKKEEINSEIRVTCCIILPDMFISELCIYTATSYWNQHTLPGNGIFGKIDQIKNKSLANEWKLILPSGFSELGTLVNYIDDEGNPGSSEHWYFGEVS